MRCAGAETPGVTPHPKHLPQGAGETEPTFCKGPQCSGVSATAVGGGNTEEGGVETVYCFVHKTEKTQQRFIQCLYCQARETDTAVNRPELLTPSASILVWLDT